MSSSITHSQSLSPSLAVLPRSLILHSQSPSVFIVRFFCRSGTRGGVWCGEYGEGWDAEASAGDGPSVFACAPHARLVVISPQARTTQLPPRVLHHCPFCVSMVLVSLSMRTDRMSAPDFHSPAGWGTRTMGGHLRSGQLFCPSLHLLPGAWPPLHPSLAHNIAANARIHNRARAASTSPRHRLLVPPPRLLQARWFPACPTPKSHHSYPTKLSPSYARAALTHSCSSSFSWRCSTGTMSCLHARTSRRANRSI
jgi:hypothetical protein